MTALACLTAVAARADRVETTDGRMIEGIFLSSGDNTTESPNWNGQRPSQSIAMRIGAVTVTLRPEQLRAAWSAPPSENALVEARDALERHETDRAAERLEWALAQGVAPEALARFLTAQAEPLAEAAAEAWGDDARVALAEALTRAAPVTTPRGCLARAQLHLAIDDAPAAARWLDRPTTAQLAAAPVAQWYDAWLVRAVERRQFAAALAALDDLARADPRAAADARAQILLNWAWTERHAGRIDRALEIYATRLMADDPRIARDRIEVTLTRTERDLRAERRLDEAARLWARYGVPHLGETARARLVQIHREMGWDAMRRSEVAAARRAFLAAEAVTTGSARTDLLVCDWRDRSARIRPGDALGHYELGVWCHEHDLLDEALKEFTHALDSAAAGANARAYIEQIRQSRAERDLLALMDLFEQGRYARVVSGLHTFSQQDYPEGYQAQARQIEQLTMDALALKNDSLEQQADALVQRAQRAYYGGRYIEADELLDMVVERFGHTPAAQRARTFRAMVQDRLELGRIEQGRAIRADDNSTSRSERVRETLARVRRNLTR